jgi:hypothetical protein
MDSQDMTDTTMSRARHLPMIVNHNQEVVLASGRHALPKPQEIARWTYDPIRQGEELQRYRMELGGQFPFAISNVLLGKLTGMSEGAIRYKVMYAEVWKSASKIAAQRSECFDKHVKDKAARLLYETISSMTISELRGMRASCETKALAERVVRSCAPQTCQRDHGPEGNGPEVRP